MRITLKPLATAALVGITLGSGVAVAQYTGQQRYADPSQNTGTTRQQQKEELRMLEQNGYQPGSKDPYYPEDLQRAEARMHGQTSMGAGAVGSSRSGGPASQDYRGNTPAVAPPANGMDMDNGMGPGQTVTPAPSTTGE